MMMPTVDFNLPLDEGTKGHFAEHGFATVPRITTDEEAAWFVTVYDRLLLDRLESARRRPGGLNGPTNNTLWISLNRWEALVFERTALLRNARQMAARLLEVPTDGITVGMRFFFKPARGGKPVPWHQDEAHKDPTVDHHSLNVWVPFEPSTEANGCLRHIPGSHLEGVLVHRHPGYGAPEVALTTDDVRPCDAMPVLLPAAGASFHHCRTVHASGPNLTNDHRRAMVLVCSAPPRPRASPANRPWLNAQHTEVPETSF